MGRYLLSYGMRKIIYSLGLSLLLAFGSTACVPGDEAPPENDLIVDVLGTEVNILTLLAINSLNGNYWQGTTTLEECVYLTPATTEPIASAITNSAACQLLQDANTDMFNSISENISISLDLQNNGITGHIYIINPHFNLLPNNFTFTVAGFTEPSSDVNKTIVRLTQTSSVATAAQAGLAESLVEFSAENLQGTLDGKLKINLTESAGFGFGSATLTLGFDLRKVL